MSYRDSLFVRCLIVPIILTLSLILLFSCSEQPTKVGQSSDSGELTGDVEIDPSTVGSFLLGSVSNDITMPGFIEVWAMDVAFDSTSGILSFDIQLLNRCRRNIPPPIHFVITDIIPEDVAVVEFDGVTGDGFPYYDFSDKLGEDDLLEPEERTERVTMKFHTVEPRSIAFGFRIDLGPPSGGGTISGIVYHDENKNGIRDSCNTCEPGIPGIVVSLEKPLDDDEKVTLITHTDSNGEYRFWGLKEGVYKVSVHICYEDIHPESWEVTSTNPLLITLVEGPDGEIQNFTEANFGLFPSYPPPPFDLFGPIIIGAHTPFGEVLDSVFTNPPSYIPIEYDYYLNVTEPPYLETLPWINVIDSASAWINDENVFEYHRIHPPDTAYFKPQTIRLPQGLVHTGENTIRLSTYGTENAALMWRVYRKTPIVTE